MAKSVTEENIKVLCETLTKRGKRKRMYRQRPDGRLLHRGGGGGGLKGSEAHAEAARNWRCTYPRKKTGRFKKETRMADGNGMGWGGWMEEGGTCVSGFTDYSCACAAGYSGPTCSVADSTGPGTGTGGGGGCGGTTAF